MLYDPFWNTDVTYCDATIACNLTVSVARVMRARRALQRIIENTSCFKSVTKVAPQQGMIEFRTANHHLNRLPQHVRDAVTQSLNMALRADSAGTSGKVKCSLHDSSINTMV